METKKNPVCNRETPKKGCEIIPGNHGGPKKSCKKVVLNHLGVKVAFFSP